METDILFNDPMVFISRTTGYMYPAYKGWISNLKDDLLLIEILGGMPGGIPLLEAESDAVAVSLLSDKKFQINITTTDESSYTIRPVKDDDAAWMFFPMGVSIPAESLEKVLQIMKEAEMENTQTAAGTPYVWAFTEGDSIQAVAFNISEVVTYFRVDGDWSLESPVDVEDMGISVIYPSKVDDFINKWDQKDGNLYQELQEYAMAEEE